MSRFSRRLSDLINTSGMMQIEIAEKLRISPQALTEYKGGRCEPSIETLIRLSDIFQTSIDYLVGRENEEGAIVLYNESASSLNKNEKKVLDDFNYLDEYSKEQVYIFLDTLVEAQKRRENSNNNFTRKYNKP